MEIKNLTNEGTQSREVDARQRLTASRSQLMRHMSGDLHGAPDSSLQLNGVFGNRGDESTDRMNGGPSIWQLVKIGLSRWWRHHPANVAAAVASPLLHRYADRKPFQLLAIAAATGAVVTIVKPWRLISVGGLASATLRSKEFSELVSSLLTSGDNKTNAADNF